MTTTAAPDVLPLRDYQVEALEAVEAARARGVTRQLLSMPTGAGKTVVAAHLVRRMAPTHRTVFMVHRDELASQSIDKLRDITGASGVGLVKAERDDVHAHMIVASAQTLARQQRLDRLVAGLEGYPVLFISDEAHHDRAESRVRAIEAVNPELLVGMTATPERGDKLGLDAVYQEIVYHLPMLALIRQSRLAHMIGRRIETDEQLDGVHTRGDEFIESELARAVNTPARNRLVVESWGKHASDRQRSVAFCVDVAHAKALRDAFRDAGVSSEVVLGETPPEERADILQRFHSGEIRVLTNCMVLTEGYDEPAIDCILMCRPTKNRGLYVQCVGRGARTATGKTDCLVLDFVDNTTRHSLIGFPTLAGEEAEQTGEAALAMPPGEGAVDLLEMVAGAERIRERRAIEVDLFGQSPVVWSPSEAGIYFAPAGQDDTEQRWVVVLPEGEAFRPYMVRSPRDYTFPPVASPLFARAVDLEIAHGIAEDAVEKTVLTSREARWREALASEKQIAFARRLGAHVPPRAGKGQVSELIDERLFARAAKRSGLPMPAGKAQR